MYANDDAFSKSGYDTMKAAAEKAGLNIVAEESFGRQGHRFQRPAHQDQGAASPDAIGISALVEPISGVLLQARQLGFGKETLFIGGNGSNSPKLGEIAGAAADGLIVGSPWFIGKDDPVNTEFVAAFRAKYGRDPDQFAAQAYDTMHIVAEAIDRAGSTDPDKLRDALLATKHSPASWARSASPTTARPGQHRGRGGALDAGRQVRRRAAQQTLSGWGEVKR